LPSQSHDPARKNSGEVKRKPETDDVAVPKRFRFDTARFEMPPAAGSAVSPAKE